MIIVARDFLTILIAGRQPWHICWKGRRLTLCFHAYAVHVSFCSSSQHEDSAGHKGTIGKRISFPSLTLILLIFFEHSSRWGSVDVCRQGYHPCWDAYPCIWLTRSSWSSTLGWSTQTGAFLNYYMTVKKIRIADRIYSTRWRYGHSSRLYKHAHI